MSTFDGYIPEFPDIRVDYFRQSIGRAAPLAYFLSHVHSDHLDGLDNGRVKFPFIYCSAATKEILVRLEKRRDRLNLAKGILEKEKRTYKHLKSVLKPIPLETPTLIELAPRNEVRVTLFDANHCTGAVMFLFENENTAVLYTGDVRSEPWFVNNLARNPILIEYTGGMKTLDCIYLDTSNTGPMSFPTKSEGLKELIGKVRKYPPNTKFHFSAWTFGYEEVWAALSRTLNSQIHVDKYKIKLYQSLRQDGSDGQIRFLAPDCPVLAGYVVGSSPKEGCLTTNQDVRIHSCEKGMGCSAYEEEDVVLIRPIITRLPSGFEVADVGIGGGWGDLVPGHELAMDPSDIKELLETVFAGTDEPIVEDIRRMLLAELLSTTEAVSLDGISNDGGQSSLKDLAESLLRKLAQKSDEKHDEREDFHNGLPKLITFPYSRHSSYPELLDLVKIFKPKDVYPCMVDEEGWHEVLSIKKLFGDHCSASIFRHDGEMRRLVATLAAEKEMSSQQTQTTITSRSSPVPRGAKWSRQGSPSTPTPSQTNIGTISRKVLSNWSEEVLTAPPAPLSQKGVAGISQASDSAATIPGFSLSSQTSRRIITTEMIDPPPLKRVRFSDESESDRATSSNSSTPSSSAAGSEQQSLNPVDQSMKGSTDLILPVKALVDLLANTPALCDQAIVALLALRVGDIGVETYISQALPVLKSIVEQIDLLAPPIILSGLHLTMRTLSQEALNILLDFQVNVDADSVVEIDVDIYSGKQLSPLQFLDREFKQVISYSKESHVSQLGPWNSARNLQSMSKIFQPEASGDTEKINNQDGLTLANDRELARDDDGDSSSDYPTDSDDPLGEYIEFSIYDPVDDILRCTECSHEIWVHHDGRSGAMPGICTGCGRGASPFYEEFDFPGAFPRIYRSYYDESEADPEEARVLIGQEHLDYQSSAYDTQDEDSQMDLNEKYEINSFIDDDEIASDSESDTSINGSEVDYKAELKKLQKKHADLRADHFDLLHEYSQFRYDMLGTSEEEDEDQDDGEEGRSN